MSAQARAPGSGLGVVGAVVREAGPMRRRMLRGIAFRFVGSMFLGLSFVAAVYVVTALRTGPLTPAQVWGAVTLVAVSLAGQLLFGFLSLRDNWTGSYAMVGQMRLRMLDRLRALPMGFHLGRQQGDTTTALTTDMSQVEAFSTEGLPTVAQALGLPTIVLAALLVIDPPLAAATALSIAVAAPVFVLANRRMARLGIERQDRQSDAVARMIAYVQGIVVVRAFNRAGSAERRFRGALQEFRDVSIRMVARLVVPLLGFMAVVQLGAPVVVAAVAYRLFGGQVDGSTAVIFLMLTLTVYLPLLGLVPVMENLRLADASMTRIRRVTDAAPQPEPRHPREPADGSVEFRDVTFGYDPARPVLTGVSFTVPERSMTAIVGPSGAGKSTLLSLVGRFHDVDDGAVLLGGVDVREMSVARLYDTLSVVFQDVYLFAGTIADNIAFGRPDAPLADIRAAAAAARIDGFVSSLPDGYRTRVGEGGATLSGGERQRISIARAILADAPVVLLDEATSAIDPTNERYVTEALAELVASRTLLVVAHKLSTIRSADQVVAVEHGRVAEIGTPAGLTGTGGVFDRFRTRRERAQGWRLPAGPGGPTG